MVDFEWLVEGGTRPIPTLASNSKLLFATSCSFQRRSVPVKVPVKSLPGYYSTLLR